jgi:hypothetical protein
MQSHQMTQKATNQANGKEELRKAQNHNTPPETKLPLKQTPKTL